MDSSNVHKIDKRSNAFGGHESGRRDANKSQLT